MNSIECNEFSSTNFNISDHNHHNDNVSIVWKNLRYEVNSWLKGRKIILQRLNGHLEYNSLTAFLGPSGAGKSTLLNCLNGQFRSGISSDSEIYINRRENDKPRICYVQQHVQETIIGSMTIRQILYYAFRFHNSFNHGGSEMDQHITNIIEQLLLDPKVLDRRFDLCSGGEQKRIAVAQELMSLKAPTFLFVDEPTTGLDSHAALLMVRCLRKLADDPNNRLTILASIHSPNSDILKMFDKLYILAKGGVCVYSGVPKLLPQNLQEHIGLVHDRNKPPIEEYLTIACKGTGDENVRRLAEATWSQQQEELKPLIPQMKNLPQGIILDHKLFSIGDFLLQIARMFQLIFIKQINSRIFTIFTLTLVCLIHSNLFEQNILQPDTCVSMIDFTKPQNNQTCQDKLEDDYRIEFYGYYQSMIVMLMGYVLNAISSLTFSSLINVFKNEHRNGWHSVGVSYWSVVFVRLIDFTILALLITTLMYFLIDHTFIDDGYFNWFRFGNFFLFMWMFFFYVQSVGQLLSIIFSNHPQVAVALSLITYAPLDFNNSYMFPYNYIVNPISKIISDIMGTKIITYGLINAFYGIDRCKPNQISSVLIDFEINQETVYTDLYRILINSVALRILTLLLMMTELNSWKFSSKKSSKMSIIADFAKIDYDKSNNELIQTSFQSNERMKLENETEFEKFSKNKIIIAWRSLSLFNSGSYLELRSALKLEEPKYILRNLNGQFRYGTLNALMGTSGAGKTSFLKVLNGRDKTRLSSETKFYLSKFTPLRTCYITQDISSHLTPGLTGLQSLIYASKLKNLGEQVDHKNNAMSMLKELDIIDTANTLVNKCSGGQRKRLALALELMSQRMPNFICIDEPTSGLDSNSAEVIISCLRKMSHKHNITIVAAIHQPNTEMLMLFDQIYILARGGVCIFSGPPSQINDHLQQVSTDHDNNDEKFAVEEIMKYSSLNHSDPKIKTLSDSTNQSILNNELENNLMTDTQYVLDGPQANRTRFSLRSVIILIQRQFYFYFGNPMSQFLILWFMCFSMGNGVILKSLINPDIVFQSGCMGLDEDFSSCNRSKDERMNLLHSYHYVNHVISSLGIISCIFFATLFVSQRKLFKIEHRNGWYSSGAFYLTKAICEMFIAFPLIVLYPIVTDIYYPVRSDVWYYMIILTILPMIAVQGASYIISIVFGRNPLNLYISIPCVMLISIISILTPHSLSHFAFKLITTFNLFRYQSEAMLFLVYGFGRCGHREIQVVLYRIGLIHDERYYYVIIMTAVNAILFQSIAILLFCLYNNPFENRRKRVERIEYLNQRQLPSKVIIPGLTCSNDFVIRKIQV
uniref:ABC transporter G family member 16-like n=1 Tax=Dermatophagoides pteronyssinus TaxID=6956 RepID=A0A6P6XSB8_DERPT|nr:ABC transporter G family member 16-like [Dermatophagoides pteronyssinus]